MERASLQTGLLFIICLILIGTVLSMVGYFVLPLVIATLMAFAVYPMVRFFTNRLRIPRALSILFVLVLLLVAGFLIGLIIFSSGQQLAGQFPEYQARFNDIIENSQMLERISLLLDDSLDISADVGLSPLQAIGSYLLPTFRSYIITISGGLLSFFSSFFMMILFLLFILIEAPYIQSKVIAAIDDSRARTVMKITSNINQQVGHYLGLKLLTSGLTAVIVTAGFSLVGVDFAVIWGVLTFMFNFIPNIGSIIISLVSMLFIFIQFYPNPTPIIIGSAVMWMAQLIIGNVVDPKLQGDRLNLSPVVILFSLLFWGWLWGIAGMFLAIPLTMVIKIVCGTIPGLRPVSILMETGKAVVKKNSVELQDED
ncbi:MAG: AI-2E family transporter [Spirochaetaceae bacterium]|nr:MAG: AI-2E family transporter [Spirochaetaceae bacterium]